MRILTALGAGAAILAAALVLLPRAQVGYAAFHCMRIHAVKAGFGGNANVQYVELRMDAVGQPLVAGHTVEFLDGSGTLKATFTFPANVTNSAMGDSILIATSEFNTSVSGGAADFTFSNANTVAAAGGDPLHPVQGPNGKVVYAAGSANCNLTAPVDSVAAGSAPADYGTAAVALTGPTDSRALRLGNLNLAPTNNSAEYTLQPVATSSFAVASANLATDFSTPRNNARTVLKLTAAVPSVGGVAELPHVAATAPLAESSNPHGRSWGLVGTIAAAAMLAAGAGGAMMFVRQRAKR